MAQKSTGTVKFYNKNKGFGFIVDDESGNDIFMHFSGLKNQKSNPKEGDSVIYFKDKNQKGQFAKDIELV